jgi:hypothetical protein
MLLQADDQAFLELKAETIPLSSRSGSLIVYCEPYQCSTLFMKIPYRSLS